MSAFYLILAWLLGVATIPLVMTAAELVEEVYRSASWRLRKHRNYGKWCIYGHAGHGSDYSNGGRYTIYREGYYKPEDILTSVKGGGKWMTRDPALRTEAEALAECERRNREL